MGKHFLPPGTKIGPEILLPPSDPTVHHLRHVLRVKPGDPVLFCDGNQNDYLCEYTVCGKNAVFTLLQKSVCQSELPYKITLFQCLPKGDKMDGILQRCVELGVWRVVPVESVFSIPRIKDADRKTERWQRIAQSAAQQSLRGVIPAVAKPVRFAEAAQAVQALPLCLAAHEKEKSVTVKSILSPLRPQDIGVFIGPEGGLSPEEIAALLSANAVCVSLGRRILRTETAGTTALAQINALWEEGAP
jgi:16S rRNA (uracil1498-N3)-methyltransferase